MAQAVRTQTGKNPPIDQDPPVQDRTAPRGRSPTPDRISPLRRTYLARLAGRCAVLLLCCAAAYRDREAFGILHGWNFFRAFSPLHILWAVWMGDMLLQLIPVRSAVALGSQKLFAFRYRPVPGEPDPAALNRYTDRADRAARRVFAVWGSLSAALWGLRLCHVLDNTALFLICVFFYVCDLVCVLVWCPFRLLLGNRCCTTCRIFNWDHLMMFSPLLPVGGFYSLSLLSVSIVVWGYWEWSVRRYPERFWEGSNAALQCGNCTDKLCTQYCQRQTRKR